jgi:hypothetical protein
MMRAKENTRRAGPHRAVRMMDETRGAAHHAGKRGAGVLGDWAVGG